MAKTVKHIDLKSYWGDEDHLMASQQKSFTQMVYELLTETTPSPHQLGLFDLILSMSIDHGSETPSAVKTIESAQAGETISEAVSKGITQITDVHGGAIEPCMNILYELKNQNSKIKTIVDDYIKQEKRMAGFGHRIYKDIDPRAQLILDKLRETGEGEEFIKILLELEAEWESQKGVKLPINIDGAIAAVLCAFDWKPELSKAVFIIARTPGLCGQYLNNRV
jgi:citrate synthase